MYRNQSFAQQLHCVPPQIKLNDISADDSIKESLSEFVEIQNSSEALKALHADIPHILLFSGGSERKCVELAQAFAAELTSVGWDYLVIDPFDFVFLANDEFQKKLTNALNEIIISSPCVVLCAESLQPHGLQYTRLPRPSSTPRASSNSCPLSQ